MIERSLNTRRPDVEMKQKLKELFERLDVERPEVYFEPGPADYRIVPVVVSPSFETMEENDRQLLVWEAILDELTDYEQQAIDTVFTFSPTEFAALIAGADPAYRPVPWG
jgi:hypothetical protein